MSRRIFWVFLFCFALSVRAGQLPLTAKEISLMLRSGYSSKAVVQELSTRRFADTLDPVNEAKLLQAGANGELIAALKAGKYSVSPEEAAQAQAKVAELTKRREQEAAQSLKFNSLYQAQVARDRASAQVQNANADAIYKFVKGDLVRSRNGSLVHADDESLAQKKLFVFYFSAHWCAPCRKFTPQLVEYYKRVAPQHPEFEIIFFSSDKSEAAMQAYMSEAGMPWPAIDYKKLSGKAVLKQNAGSGIPSLVLVDASGKVLSTTYVGSQNLGPAKVLGDLDAILSGGAPQVAASH